jgi:hypothetical protein
LSEKLERLSKTEIRWKGLVPAVETALAAWQPALEKTELAYSNALAGHLRAVFPADARIEREYRHEGTTCDVCVLLSGFLSEGRILIEVKRNLRKKADFDRLVGQIEGLKPKANNVILVLVGDTDPALLGRLRSQFKGYLDEGLFGTKFRIVVKGES